MIGQEVKSLLLKNQGAFLIPDEKVAHVMDTHPLNHALLVLTKVMYTTVPVLNRDGQIVGLIGLSDIVDAMFDLTAIDPANLNDKLVKDVMNPEVKQIQEPYDIEYILHLLVDHPFISVVDEEQQFKGILTRKEILKAVNHMVHTLESDYTVVSKTVSNLKIS